MCCDCQLLLSWSAFQLLPGWKAASPLRRIRPGTAGSVGRRPADIGLVCINLHQVKPGVEGRDISRLPVDGREWCAVGFRVSCAAMTGGRPVIPGQMLNQMVAAV